MKQDCATSFTFLCMVLINMLMLRSLLRYHELQYYSSTVSKITFSGHNLLTA